MAQFIPRIPGPPGPPGPQGPPGPPSAHSALTGLDVDDHAIYLALAGRSGTANDILISLTGTGTILGSGAAGFGLDLGSGDGPPGLHIRKNALGIERLLLGDGPDPLESVAPGGAFQLVLTSSGSPIGSAMAANTIGAQGMQVLSVQGNGSFASPTASVSGDNIFGIGAFGTDDAGVSWPFIPAAVEIGFAVAQPSSPSVGFVPGQMVMRLVDFAGNQSVRFEIDGNGIMFLGGDGGDDLKVSSEADLRLSQRTVDPSSFGAGTIFYDTSIDKVKVENGSGTFVPAVFEDGAGGISDITHVRLKGADKKFGAQDVGPVYLSTFGSDVTNAVQIRLSDDTTVLLHADTENSLVGINNTAPTQALDVTGGFLITGVDICTPDTGQIITAAGDQILAVAREVEIANASGAITLTSTPTIDDGEDGQIVRVLAIGPDDVTIQDEGTLAGSNLYLSANTITLSPRDNITLRYSATIGGWVQVGFTNVV